MPQVAHLEGGLRLGGEDQDGGNSEQEKAEDGAARRAFRACRGTIWGGEGLGFPLCPGLWTSHLFLVVLSVLFVILVYTSSWWPPISGLAWRSLVATQMGRM